MREARAGRTGGRTGPATGSVEDRFADLMAGFRDRVNRRLDAFLEEKRESWSGREDAAELVEGVARLVRGGGKRMRPALVYYAYRSCGGRSAETVMPLAMATEFLHTYLLIHDDVMDRSDLRRGRTTSHVLFSDRHRERAWPGDSEHFGQSVALLLGDLAYSWAMELFHSVPVDGDRRERIRRTFSSMCEEVIFGQYMETVLPYRREVTEAEVLEVVRLKSGRYSVERPVELGALLAGAPAGRLDVLRRWGRAVGLAFQLQDDILGTFGDADRAGKPGGSDLVEGKMTLLAHTALEAAPPEEAEELREVLLDPSPSPGDVDRGREIIRQCGALRRVRGRIGEELEEAIRAVDRHVRDEEGRAFFGGFPAYLEGREK